MVIDNYFWNGREPENQEELERFIYAKLMRELLTDICEDDPTYILVIEKK